ncbi:MAG: threonine synthase [Gammaproteobacteria bacterium]
MTGGIIAAHRAHLPLPPDAPPLSLGEGNTPLLPLRLGDKFGLRLFAKNEGANPTGSFKDRGMVVATSAAMTKGARVLLCASTGNTSASAAAYAARAKMVCAVLLPAGKVAAGKIAQAAAFGAKMIAVSGNFDDAMRAVCCYENSGGEVAVVNSTNPMRLQGQKTAAFEVCKQLGAPPDYHALPVGNAGNITAHWIGYAEYTGRGFCQCSHCGGKCPFIADDKTENKTNNAPVMLGYQAAGAAPFLRGAPVAEPKTRATAIQIGNPQSFVAAKAAVKESGGWFGELEDEEILAMQKTLAREEGIFCEPASAASVAGVLKDAAAGKFADGARIVCTLTGNGLKDPESIAAEGIIKPPPGEGALREIIDTLVAGG